MVNTGKMHGYMRMYWCKKILEWTKYALEPPLFPSLPLQNSHSHSQYQRTSPTTQLFELDLYSSYYSNAKEAMNYACLLNDKYELDGRDPNGYVGCAWSIGGVHDQGIT